VHENSNQKELISYLHAACFSPVKSTWIKAIKNENVTSWPGLPEQAVEKHLSKSTATVKGRTNQQRMHARSTKPKKEEDCKNESETSTVDAGKIYTDQTGRFPVLSNRGSKYIMVLYEYDDNAIMAHQK
jgi:hypothetical protein